MFQPDEPFAEARNLWDLDRLYADLAEKKGERLTSTEKTQLRGLLLGLRPQDIAKELHISVGGLRVALSRTLYRYVTDLVGVPIKSIAIAHRLEQSGYRHQKLTLFQSSLPSDLTLQQPFSAIELDVPGG
jgi:hypothetical protein